VYTYLVVGTTPVPMGVIGTSVAADRVVSTSVATDRMHLTLAGAGHCRRVADPYL